MAQPDEWHSLSPGDVSDSPERTDERSGDEQPDGAAPAAVPAARDAQVQDAGEPSAAAQESGFSRDAGSSASQAGERRPPPAAPDSSGSALRFEEESDEEAGGGTAQERWQRTDAYMRDVQQAFRARPALRVQANERWMKLLLVGEPGLGKDLLVKNLFAPYCADNDLPVAACAPDTEPAAFAASPHEFCTEVAVEVDDGRTKIHYLLQDTPGTHLPGADRAILRHAVQQSREYMAAEEDPRRVVPLSTLPDSRVDACLFFLSPHFLKPQDVALMSRLSEFVPVIPLIAKADALTTAELEAYRSEVRRRLATAAQQAGRTVMHAFSQADLEAAGAVREVPPFAVICSTEVDDEVGSHWFTRTFPWGRCEVMSSNHSDLPALKALLFEVCFEALKAGTEARFYAARESHLTSRALSRALSSAELPPSVAHPLRPQPPAPLTPPRLPGSRGQALRRERAGGSAWKWRWGLAVGSLALAFGVQLALLRLQAVGLRRSLEGHRRQATAEQQALVGLVRSLGID